MIIPVWNVEKDNIGYTLVLKDNILELVKYEMPVTSHSSGGMDTYEVTDLYENSGLWKEIAAIFGEYLAKEILQKVENAGSIAESDKDNRSGST